MVDVRLLLVVQPAIRAVEAAELGPLRVLLTSQTARLRRNPRHLGRVEERRLGQDGLDDAVGP